MHVALQANIIVAQENDIFIERDHFSPSLLSAAVGALNGTSRGESSTQALDAFLVRTEVPRRAHCCEQSTRDADWPNGARETRPPARPCIIHTLTPSSRSRVYMHVRGRKRETEVGGLCEPLPLRTLGLRNNRILVRAASRRGCAPL